MLKRRAGVARQHGAWAARGSTHAGAPGTNRLYRIGVHGTNETAAINTFGDFATPLTSPPSTMRTAAPLQASHLPVWEVTRSPRAERTPRRGPRSPHGLLPHRDMPSALPGEWRPAPPFPALHRPQPRDPRHQVEFGGPDVPEGDRQVLTRWPPGSRCRTRRTPTRWNSRGTGRRSARRAGAGVRGRGPRRRTCRRGSPMVTGMWSPPGLARRRSVIARDMSMPCTGTPLRAGGRAIRLVPTANSRAGPPAAWSARKSTVASLEGVDRAHPWTATFNISLG